MEEQSGRSPAALGRLDEVRLAAVGERGIEHAWLGRIRILHVLTVPLGARGVPLEPPHEGSPCRALGGLARAVGVHLQ